MSMTPSPENIRDVYAWKTTVATYDVGPDRLLTPSAQLRLQQEAGERHFGEGGLDFEGVARLGLAFVVLQNNARILRRPQMREAITVKTWSRRIKGARFFRCYRFEDEQGNLLIDSMASFGLVDLNTHAMLRPSQFPFAIAEHSDPEHSCVDAPRLKRPGEGIPCGTHTVALSQLDFNGHLNNTRYADIVFDHLPADTVARMSGFSIAFQHEAKCGDVLTLTRTDTDEGILLAAQNGDDPCFLAQVRL